MWEEVQMLAFIDQSGTIHRNDDHEHSTIAAVCIREHVHTALAKHLHGTKLSVYGAAVSAVKELHAADMLNRSTFTRAQKGKQIAAMHVRFVDSVFSRFLPSADLSIFAVVVERPTGMLADYGAHLPLQFERLLERIFLYGDAIQMPADERVILVFDSDICGKDGKFSHAVSHFLFTEPTSGQAWASRLLETAFFVGSHLSPGVQLADLAASCIRQYHDMDIESRYWSLTDPYDVRVNQYYHILRQKTQDFPVLQGGKSATNYGFYRIPASKLDYLTRMTGSP
jgi:hypothetical protein